MIKRILFTLLAVLLMFSTSLYAASWKDKLKEKLGKGDSDNQSAPVVADPEVFQPLSPLRWDQDYREAIRAMCESGKSEYMYFDDDYELAVSKSLRKHPEYGRGTISMVDAFGSLQVKDRARLPIATACKDDLFLNNTFPVQGTTFTQLDEEEIISGKAAVTFAPVMIAGLPFSATLTFGQDKGTELSTGYFKKRQKEGRPFETTTLKSTDWIIQHPAPTQQEVNSISATLQKPLQQCFQRSDSMSEAMAAFSASVGNEVDNTSINAMANTFKSNCICTYENLSRYAALPNAAADYVKIEKFLQENWAADSNEFVTDIKRELLVARLAGGHQNLTIYSSAMMSCEMESSGPEAPKIRRTRLPGDLKQDDDHVKKPVPRDVPLNLALPLMKVQLGLLEELGLTGSELHAAQGKIIAAFDNKFASLQRFDWTDDISNEKLKKKRKKMVDMLKNRVCTYNRYLGVDWYGDLLRYGNERETYCLHSEPTDPNQSVKLVYSTMVFGVSENMITYQAPPDVFNTYYDAYRSYYDSIRKKASDEGLGDL